MNEDRLDFIEFRMDLLRKGSELANYLYDCKINRKQYDSLMDIMQSFRDRIDNGEMVSSSEYEAKILDVVRDNGQDYHFCESFARMLWEEDRFTEVFETVYKDSQKYKRLFEN